MYSMVTAILLLLPLLSGTVLGSTCGIHCYFCKPNGPCTHCNSGWYGSGCNSTCPQTCPGSCHKTTGFCKSCLEGTYGNFCQGKCSPNCNGGRLCNRRDGDCSQGCQKGFHGSRCTVMCGHCVDGACERLSGSCIAGCTDGWTGQTCSEACRAGCIKCTTPNACVLCDGDFQGPFCNVTKTMTIFPPSPPAKNHPLNDSDIAQTDVESGAAVGISLGIIFTILIVLLIICVLVYTDGIKKSVECLIRHIRQIATPIRNLCITTMN